MATLLVLIRISSLESETGGLSIVDRLHSLLSIIVVVMNSQDLFKALDTTAEHGDFLGRARRLLLKGEQLLVEGLILILLLAYLRFK